MINDVANEMVLQPSMSSNDVKTVVSNNHEMASTSSLVAEPLKKKRKKYTDEETTLIKYFNLRAESPSPSLTRCREFLRSAGKDMAEYRTEKHIQDKAIVIIRQTSEIIKEGPQQSTVHNYVNFLTFK